MTRKHPVVGVAGVPSAEQYKRFWKKCEGDEQQLVITIKRKNTFWM